MPDIVIRRNVGTIDWRPLIGVESVTPALAQAAVEAVAAAEAAEAAGSDAIAAKAAAELAQAAAEAAAAEATEISGIDTLDEGNAALIDNETSLTRQRLSEAVAPIVQDVAPDILAADPTIAAGAIAAATTAVNEKVADLEIPTAEELAVDQLSQNQTPWPFAAAFGANREVSFGMRPDKTFYPQAQVEQDMAQMRAPLDVSTGWRWAVAYEGTREVIIGRRVDGTWYPPSITEAAVGGTLMVRGDSITAGWAPYTAALATALGRAVVIRGEGGQGSRYIAAAQGGQPFLITVSGGSLPASTAATNVTIAYPTTGAIAMPYPRSFAGVLAGVRGTLTITADGAGTFTPLNAPTMPVPVAASTPFLTGETDRNPGVAILWPGRNNVSEPAQIVADIRAMLDWLTPEARAKALVFSILPSASETTGSSGRATLDATNAAIRAAFPTRYEDVATRLRSPELITAAGGTPSSQDTTDIANGVTPSSFRSDSLHLGALGYAAMNLLTATIITTRGI